MNEPLATQDLNADALSCAAWIARFLKTRGIDRIFGRIGEEGVRLLFSNAFQCGEIRLGPAGVMLADAVNYFRRERAEDPRVQRRCDSRGQGRVRRRSDAAGRRGGSAQRRGLLGLRECLPGALSGGRRRRGVADAENHAGLDAEARR